jgi:hypothetical protein
MTSPTSPANLAPAGPGRQQRGIRLPQLLLSLLVVAVFALLAVWWQASTTSRRPVVALANDVSIGVPLTREDLTEIYISTDIPPRVEDAAFLELFIGTYPVADLPAGTLITGEMFRRTGPLLTGQAFVGLVLDGSRAPSGLVPGDRVQVLVADPDGAARTLSPDARVELTQESNGQVILRLRLDVDAAQAVQLQAGSVVVIEVENTGLAPWEVAPS